MEQQIQKKDWKTPELIILVRSKPEEAVLAVCKDALRKGPGEGVNRCTPTSGSNAQCTLVNLS